MNKIFKGILIKTLGKKKYYKKWRRLYYWSIKGMNYGNGGGVVSSGECNVFIELEKRQQQKYVIFDVGANVGSYSLECLDKFGTKAEIHAFEPSRVTYKKLIEHVTSDNIICNNFGLSDKEGTQILFSDKEESGLASLYQRKVLNVSFENQEKVTLDTLDHYCKNKNITWIDLLKIDIEGNEINALKGAEGMLSQKQIGMIQFEFGGCNIDSRTFFRDFWYMLHENYKLFIILEDGFAEIDGYDAELEVFQCINYLAILKR